MSAKRKSVSLIVALAMLVSCFSFGAAPVIAKTTEADTPVGVGNAHLKWEKKFGDSYAYAVTPPLLIGDNIYVAAKGTLYKLDKETGAVIDKCYICDVTIDYTTIAPVHNGSREDGSDATRIYVPINFAGRIAAVDISGSSMKLAEEWENGLSEKYGYQAITPIVFRNNHLYTGSYGSTPKDPTIESFVEIDAATGKVTRLAKNEHGGFYWAGAYVTADFAVFGEEEVGTYVENGVVYTEKSEEEEQVGESILRSVAISGNTLGKETGECIDKQIIEGSVRGNMVCNKERDGNYLYFVAKAKMPDDYGKIKRLYKIKIEDNGVLGTPDFVELSGESVGVPIVTDSRIYVGTSAGKIDVVDPESMVKKYSISVPGYPQGEMLVKKKDAQTDYIYTTYNKSPGGLYYIEAGEAKVIQSGNLYIPTEDNHKENCISPVICDDAGTLYFKNDSGYIFAVAPGAPTFDKTAPVLKKTSANAASTKLSWSARKGASAYEVYRATSANGAYKRIATTTALSYADKTTLPKTAYYYKVRAKVGANYTNYSNAVSSKVTLAKPRIQTKAGKKKITVTWKKVTGATGYKVYRATKKSGKYKLVKTIRKQSTVKFINKKLKKNKKYYYKVRAFKTVSGKTAYSAYSNISYKKAK